MKTKSLRYHDLSGQQFGRLSVVKRIGATKNRHVLWLCTCDCGNKCEVASNHLKEGHTTSCGCYQKERVSSVCAANLIGKKFNRLTVLEKLNRRIQRALVWKCQCDCGNIVEVHTATLKNGHTKSCGCYHFDKIWKGGVSCEPYCINWTKEFKEFIKDRDENKCLNPDCWGNIHALCVHHIDYNKKNCEPENLITLCRSCNSRANKNREYHKAWYRAILVKKYIYKY